MSDLKHRELIVCSILLNTAVGDILHPIYEPAVVFEFKKPIFAVALMGEHSMNHKIDPRQLTLISLAYRCRVETDRYFAGKRYDPRYGYELFRRALEEPHKKESKEVWPFVQAQYKPLAVKWVRKHWRFKLTDQSADSFAEEGLARMWDIFAREPGKFDKFATLASLLSYLKMCVGSAVTEFALSSDEDILEISDKVPSQGSLDSALIADALWRCIEERLKEQQERVVAYESFVNERRPREIFAIYPDLFPNIKAVSRTKEKIVKRFRRREDDLRDCLK